MLSRTKPMNPGTKGLKRTGFARKSFGFGQPISEVDRDTRLAENAMRATESAAFTARFNEKNGIRVLAKAAKPGLAFQVLVSISKDKPLRSELYRRLVAALPCAFCGIAGYSQHAHENEGKGKGLKVDDRRAMPLCCTRPGIEGCHAAFDQYRLIPGGRAAHIELGRELAQQTRSQIREAGHWPAKVPQWQEGEGNAD
ncbi:hypothetical protein [Lampropedia aestuarii]|uniref:hypothetical protein n=1 Tax=Lampropedia aestuarii TaxID=2562762 RepID=UPI0024699D89|nr:hypothetical protein [Lampropedia aestuarii]MDH5857782.1 hypothetical protein [Lampropedia aestuarii]